MDLDTFWKIKSFYRIEKLNVAQISRRLNLDPKTVKRTLEKEHFEKRKSVSRKSILDPYKESIKSMLERYNYSCVQVYNMIKEEGFYGEISIVRTFIAKVRPVKKEAYLTLNFEPGEASQVDFGYCGYINIGDIRRRLYVFSMVLCNSRMMYIEFIMQQNKEHFLECHRNAFEFFGGVPSKIMVDNCKVAVLQNSKYTGIKYNPSYLDFSAYYNFQIKACGVRKPNEKGLVEKSISYIKGNLLAGQEIASLIALNNSAKYWLDNTANVRIHKRTKKQPVELFKIEKEHLGKLPNCPYDCARIINIRANSQFRINFESNRYSVPAEYASTQLKMKVYPDKILVYNDANKLITSHIRSYEKNIDFEKDEHIKKLLDQKMRAEKQVLLRRFLRICDVANDYYVMLKDKKLNPIKHIRRILALYEYYGSEKTTRALQDALYYQAFGSEYISNLLEQRHKLQKETPLLHLVRKKDLLDISIDKPNLDLYNNF